MAKKKIKDGFYTPKYAISPLLEYIEPYSVVWCPFDHEDSYYVKTLREHKCEVIHTHIDDGGDFFKLNVPCDYIVSCLPPSKKDEVFERLYELGRPFAMLVSTAGLFDSIKRFEIFSDKRVEVLYFDRRISFFENKETEIPEKDPTFASAYVCSCFLTEQIEFREIYKPRRKKTNYKL